MRRGVMLYGPVTWRDVSPQGLELRKTSCYAAESVRVDAALEDKPGPSCQLDSYWLHYLTPLP